MLLPFRQTKSHGLSQQIKVAQVSWRWYSYVPTVVLYLLLLLCFYSSLEQTNQTLALERAFCTFSGQGKLSLTKSKRGIQLVTICKFTARYL